jgi:hypothetical protein
MVIVLPDEVMARVRRLAEERGAEVSNVVAALVAEATAPSPSTPVKSPDSLATVLEEPSGITRGPHSGIAVRVRWDLIGRGRSELIQEPKASATMRRVIERLTEELGPETLSQLANCRVNRGPLVSRNPDADYAGPSNGVRYASHPIGSTGWHVLTHSATHEKVAVLRGLPEYLRQPVGFVEVEQYEK